jgi:pyrroline-5-carboxylate reductase
MAWQYEFGFIGAGHMAEGIIAAALEKKLYTARQITVSDPSPERQQLFREKYQVDVHNTNGSLMATARRIVLAVKPQQFGNVAAELSPQAKAEQLFVSIMAGVKTTAVEASFPQIDARVVRVMPNLPIRVGAGMAGVFAGQHAGSEDVEDVAALFNAGGGTVVVHHEELMDAVTAVSGSGPAYFYYFVESIVKGAQACGLSESDALDLARQTCLGAARMMIETQEDPAALRRKVTSKGGTTQAALEHMDSMRVGEHIADAVRAAYNRGQELGG